MIMQIQMFEEQWTKKVIWLICLCVIEFYVTIEYCAKFQWSYNQLWHNLYTA